MKLVDKRKKETKKTKVKAANVQLTTEQIIKKIANIKTNYEAEGFIVLGIFGSYARGEATVDSDLDILFETNNTFLNKYKGWEIFGKIEAIREELESKMGIKIDLIDRAGIDEIGKKYILPEVLYV